MSTDRAKSRSTGKADLPHLDFSTFVLGIIGTAFVHLGDSPSPDGVEEKDLNLARHDIDLLGVLQDKTKGNLTGDEERLLSTALTDLRLRYVEVSGAPATGKTK